MVSYSGDLGVSTTVLLMGKQLCTFLPIEHRHGGGKAAAAVWTQLKPDLSCMAWWYGQSKSSPSWCYCVITRGLGLVVDELTTCLDMWP